MRALLEASAVLQVIKSLEDEQALRVFDDNCVLDLTKYEVGNGIWKEYAFQHAIREEKFNDFLVSLQTVVNRSELLVPGPGHLLPE